MAQLSLRLHSLLLPLLLALLFSPWLTAATNVTVEYWPQGMPPITCANNGTTSVGSTQVGHASYASIHLANANPTLVTTTAATFSNLVGCQILWNTLPGFMLYGNSANWGDIFNVTGDSGLTTFSHTFSATGIPTTSGPQLEASIPNNTGVLVVNDSLQTFSDAYTGLPIATGLRITNRSSLANLSLTAPGWVVTSPVNCTAKIEHQPTGSLSTDQGFTSTFRVTPTTPGAFSVTFKLTSNDAASPYTFRVDGTATDRPRLVVFNGTTKLSSYSRITVTTPVGKEKRVTFTLRNEDTVPITFAADLSSGAAINCSPTTTQAPVTTLQPGQATRWQIAFTPTASDWQFVPMLQLSSPSNQTYYWIVYNRPGFDPYTAPPSSGYSSGAKCGMGGGVNVILLLGLGGLLAVASGRLIPRRRND
jgi:hypothetical protein